MSILFPLGMIRDRETKNLKAREGKAHGRRVEKSAWTGISGKRSIFPINERTKDSISGGGEPE